MKPIITVKEARKIMGKDADKLNDEQVEKLIDDLDFIAKASLEDARKKRIQEDAHDLANLIYDIYKDNKTGDGSDSA